MSRPAKSAGPSCRVAAEGLVPSHVVSRRSAPRESGCLRAAVLRETLHLTNGNLNRHLKVLVDAGLLESTR
ncbi:MAG: helix-turn-helix transcriptional regulator, partial [Rhodococcus sp.]